MAKEFMQLNVSLPDWINLESNGVKQDGPSGATSFQPWSNFKGWREGKRVIVLNLKTQGFLMLPVFEISEMERESIRGILRMHIDS